MHTPMEEYAGKHSDAVQIIEDVIERDYKVVFNKSHELLLLLYFGSKGSLLLQENYI